MKKTGAVWRKILGMQKIIEDQYSRQISETTNQNQKENNEAEKQKKRYEKVIHRRGNTNGQQTHEKNCSASLRNQ